MWIAELLDNRWSNQVISDISAFEEESKGDGILQFYVFLHENIGYTKEAIILAEQQLTKEKLALENFDYDISKFTSCWNIPTSNHKCGFSRHQSTLHSGVLSPQGMCRR